MLAKIRYFFHVHDTDGVVADDEGSELPDLAAAQAEARLSARDFAIESLRGGEAVNGRWIEIADDQGRMLGRLAIRAVIN